MCSDVGVLVRRCVVVVVWDLVYSATASCLCYGSFVVKLLWGFGWDDCALGVLGWLGLDGLLRLFVFYVWVTVFGCVI